MQPICPPPPFLQVPGEPPIKWKDWYRAFNAYLGAIDGLRFRPDRKKWVLLHSLGLEGQSILEHLPPLGIGGEGDEIDEYQTTIKRLELHFDKPPNIVV